MKVGAEALGATKETPDTNQPPKKEEETFELDLGSSSQEPEVKPAALVEDFDALIPIDELDEEEGKISTEGYAFKMSDSQKKVLQPPMLPAIKVVGMTKDRTVLAKEYTLNICEESELEVEYMMHVLFHAQEDVKIKIYLNTDGIDNFHILDLVTALSTTKAEIELYVVRLNTMQDLLVLTAGVPTQCYLKQRISGPGSWTIGGLKNMELGVEFARKYFAEISETLVTEGILTEDEVNDLVENKKPILMEADRFKRKV